ncbi:MAG: 50S ribosomal protein L17 [Bacteroidetes bacterium]|nr:50S ribosomal protein L17 [Bacteroidota bacterium]
MRHGNKVNNLSRKKGHRKALLSNLASALIEHKRIQTTLAKAKALRLYLEPLITKSKDNTTHSRRMVFKYLQNKSAVQELFDNVAGKIADRPGGYLRIIKIGARLGDASEMALIEFVDFNETYVTDKKSKSTGKRKRTRRGKSKTADTETAPAPEETAAPVAEAAVETVVEDKIEEAEVAEEQSDDENKEETTA